MNAASDDVINARARAENRVIISTDTDFGTVLALLKTKKPSFILFRWPSLRQAAKQAGVILANLANIQDDLDDGAVVVIEPTRIRVRSLPISGKSETNDVDES